MIEVSKSVLKARMLEFFRLVEKTGEEIIVTSNHVPVIKIMPLKKKHSPDDIFHKYQGKVEYHEDILEDTSSEWEER